MDVSDLQWRKEHSERSLILMVERSICINDSQPHRLNGGWKLNDCEKRTIKSALVLIDAILNGRDLAVRDPHVSKVCSPIDVMMGGRLMTHVSALQLRKVFVEGALISVVERSICVNDTHHSKTLHPIDSMIDGSLMLVKRAQPTKAPMIQVVLMMMVLEL